MSIKNIAVNNLNIVGYLGSICPDGSTHPLAMITKFQMLAEMKLITEIIACHESDGGILLPTVLQIHLYNIVVVIQIPNINDTPMIEYR